MSLIVIGGIGFLTWDDIVTQKCHIHNYRMQSKVILVTTGLLILIPTIGFFIFEFRYLPLKERILASFFQSVTPRTAGANTVDLTAMSEPGQMTMIALMLIGGSPGSTAGGMKTTTFGVILACKEIAIILLGLAFIAVGATNRNGRPSIIHWYNWAKVTENDRPKYGKVMGNAMLAIGASFALTGVFQILCDWAYVQVLSGFGVSVGLVLMLHAQLMYNKAIF